MSRKMTTLALSLSAMATTAFAGGLTAPAPEPAIIEVMPTEPSSMSAWLVPLIIVILIALAMQPPPAPSDRRIKRDIRAVGPGPRGLTIYRYRYVGLPMTFEGVMAQEVAEKAPEALARLPFGLLAVRYEKLGIELRRVA